MHQTVREFFRPAGPTGLSVFRMSGNNDAHLGIAISCIRYLMLCATNPSLSDPPNPTTWTTDHFEACVRYLHERPFIKYALSYLQEHLHKCRQVTRILALISQTREQFTSGPVSCILEAWVPQDWRLVVATEKEQHDSKEFRNRLLHTATRMKCSQVVDVLLIAGAEVEACLDGKTPLMVSAEIGDCETARVLLDRGASMRAKDNDKQTALHLAARNGYSNVVGLLIDRGAEKEATDNKGRTALHLAAVSGQEGNARLLLDQGAGIEARDAEWQTALHLAAANGRDSFVALLMNRGIRMEAEDTYGWQALHTAAWNGHGGTVKMLVETLSADKEARDECGWTALHVAAFSGRNTIVEMIVKKLGADKDAKDKAGWTALHFVAALGLKDTVQMLIKILDVDKHAQNREGKTALDLAREL